MPAWGSDCGTGILIVVISVHAGPAPISTARVVGRRVSARDVLVLFGLHEVTRIGCVTCDESAYAALGAKATVNATAPMKKTNRPLHEFLCTAKSEGSQPLASPGCYSEPTLEPGPHDLLALGAVDRHRTAAGANERLAALVDRNAIGTGMHRAHGLPWGCRWSRRSRSQGRPRRRYRPPPGVRRCRHPGRRREAAFGR